MQKRWASRRLHGRPFSRPDRAGRCGRSATTAGTRPPGWSGSAPAAPQSFYARPARVRSPLRLAGDGSGRVIETAACGSSVCLESVNGRRRASSAWARCPAPCERDPGALDGRRRQRRTTGGEYMASRTGQFFLRLTAANPRPTYPFTVPRLRRQPCCPAAGAPGRQRRRLGLDRVHLELHLHRQHIHRLHRRPRPLQAVGSNGPDHSKPCSFSGKAFDLTERTGFTALRPPIPTAAVSTPPWFNPGRLHVRTKEPT